MIDVWTLETKLEELELMQIALHRKGEVGEEGMGTGEVQEDFLRGKCLVLFDVILPPFSHPVDIKTSSGHRGL